MKIPKINSDSRNVTGSTSIQVTEVTHTTEGRKHEIQKQKYQKRSMLNANKTNPNAITELS